MIPLHEMAESFGLTSKSRNRRPGSRQYFTLEGKVALMFLKMKPQMSAPKLLEQLNGNIHFQLFCGIAIDPMHPLTNYKLIDDIALELAGKLKFQEQQKILADMWKPYMDNLDTMYTDATCYESDMRFPTDPKLLWEGIEKAYGVMYRLQKNHFESNDPRESVKDRIVSISKPYVRPIVRGKEVKNVEFGAKVNNILVDGLSFIEKLSFNAFNEGTRLAHYISLHEKLFGVIVFLTLNVVRFLRKDVKSFGFEHHFLFM